MKMVLTKRSLFNFKNKKFEMVQTVWLFKSEFDGSSDRYVEELTCKGFHVEIIPTLCFNFINEKVLQDAINNPEKYSGIIFTSVRAVEAFAKIYEKAVISLHSQWSAKKIFAIGPTTSLAVNQKLLISPLGKDAGNAHQLSSIILENTIPFDKPLLFPCGNLKRDELPTLLASNDRDFRALTAYETMQHPQLQSCLLKLTSVSKPNFMVFFSPSGVNFALPILNKLNFDIMCIKILAFGPTTNAALVKNNIPVLGICSDPSPTGLLQLLR